MRKKQIPPSEHVIPREILDKAKREAHPDKLPLHAKCVVCGAAGRPIPSAPARNPSVRDFGL